MPKRTKKPGRSTDVNQLVDDSTRENGDRITPPTKAQISMFMARLGRKGGKVGGKRRLETMTPAQRSDVARKAAEARWAKETKP